MKKQGKFRRQITLVDLVFIGLGSIFGSGWLFAAAYVASMAGPAGWISWVIGGIAVILLGLVYAELGGAIPRAGGHVRYPAYTHGPLVGFLMSFATLIAYSSIIAIEVKAARQYATAWWPALTQSGSSGSPTILGWMFELTLLIVFFLLNYWSIKTFVKSNIVISIIKFLVPSLTIIVLLLHLKGENFQIQGFAPFGFIGVESAISAGGVIFAYLGLHPIVALAAEAKNPQRTVPISLILSIVLSTIVYVLLQVAFIGAIPTEMLSVGWAKIGEQFTLPYRDVALLLGYGWLAVLITLDAIVSPSGTGNIFMSSTPRMVFGWARSGTLFRVFAQVDEQTGIPRPALWLTLALSVFWTLPFPSWGTLIGVVSSALVLTYALAPISAQALRKNAPDLPRPFYLKGMSIIGPISFVVASLMVYWTGWNTNSWLLGVQLLLFIIYVVFNKAVPTDQISFVQQLKSSWWLVFYYLFMIVLSYLGTFSGGANIIKSPWDQILVCMVSLVVYYWGANARLPQPIFDEDAAEIDDLPTKYEWVK